MRTGTRNGLEKAEDWAQKLLASDNVSQSISSFHPIIAVWAYLGESKNVQEWINKYKHKDGRYSTAILLSFQQGNKNLQESINDSQQCMEYLQSVVYHQQQEGESPKIFLDACNFGYVIQSWYQTAVLASSDEDNNTTTNSLLVKMDQHHRNPKEYCISQMIECFKLYNQWMKHCVKEKNQSIKNNYQEINIDSEISDIQYQHLLQMAPLVYSQILFNLRQIPLNSNCDDDTTFITPYFSHMEQMLRRSEECQSILFRQEKEQNKQKDSSLFYYSNDDTLHAHSNVQYSDSFDFLNFSSTSPWYPNHEMEKEEKSHPIILLYHNVLEGCLEATSKSYYGDAIRITMFLLNRILSKNKSISTNDNTISPQGKRNVKIEMTEIYKSMITLVGLSIPHKQDRTSLMRHMLDLFASSTSNNQYWYETNTIMNEVEKYVSKQDIIMMASVDNDSKKKRYPRKKKMTTTRTIKSNPVSTPVVTMNSTIVSSATPTNKANSHTIGRKRRRHRKTKK